MSARAVKCYGFALGVGVGAFLVVAIMKIVFKQSLSHILMLFYMLLFALALMLFVPPVYTGIAFSLPVSDVAGLAAKDEPEEA